MSGKYEVEINLSSKKRLNGRKKEREQMREKKKDKEKKEKTEKQDKRMNKKRKKLLWHDFSFCFISKNTNGCFHL